MRTLFLLLLVLSGCGPDSTASIAVEDEGPVGFTQDELNWLGNDPQLWRGIWASKYRSHLGVAVEPAVSRPSFAGAHTVLLVPGTTIGEEFFAPMAARLRRDGFDVVVWAPPDLFTESLATGAARIGAKVDELLALRHKTRLSVVAECDGGVAARYYAQVLGGDARLDQLVTFVSAHHGSSVAPGGSWFTGWPALQDVKPNSALLTRLNSTPFPAGLKLTSIYTCWDEYLWPQSTSFVQGATNVQYCNHYASHFSGFWDPVVYERILTALRGEGGPAGGPVEQR
jgi:hypothetical protein